MIAINLIDLLKEINNKAYPLDKITSKFMIFLHHSILMES